jgi:hypothetical protein
LNGVSYFGEFNSKIVMRQVTKDGTTVIDWQHTEVIGF